MKNNSYQFESTKQKNLIIIEYCKKMRRSFSQKIKARRKFQKSEV